VDRSHIKTPRFLKQTLSNRKKKTSDVHLPKALQKKTTCILFVLGFVYRAFGRVAKKIVHKHEKTLYQKVHLGSMQFGRWLLMQEGPLQKEMTDPDGVEFAVWTYFLLFLNSLLPCPKKSRWGRTFYGHYFKGHSKKK
jgi:hypothetical protein